MAGRKSKFTPEVVKKITDALRVGNTRKAAAEASGISESLFYEWIKKGEAARNGPFLEFLEAVTRAEAECEVQNVAIIKKAAAGWETRTVRTKTQTVEEITVDGSGKPIAGADGKPLKTVTTQTETITTEGKEFDWRAALEWLKRRKRADWGDTLDISKIDDETLIGLLERDAAARNATAGAHPAPASAPEPRQSGTGPDSSS